MHTICPNRNVRFFEIKRVIHRAHVETLPKMSWLNLTIKQISNIVKESLDATKQSNESKITIQGS